MFFCEIQMGMNYMGCTWLLVSHHRPVQHFVQSLEDFVFFLLAALCKHHSRLYLLVSCQFASSVDHWRIESDVSTYGLRIKLWKIQIHVWRIIVLLFNRGWINIRDRSSRLRVLTRYFLRYFVSGRNMCSWGGLSHTHFSMVHP